MGLAVRVTKRLTDLFLGSTCLVVFSPMMLLIAVAIKTTSQGPVFYKQRRAGMVPGDPRPEIPEFDMYKFRSMIADAEKYTGTVLSRESDPRITFVGRLLRATRMDELPQFLNVIKGEMSVVGPRPERPDLVTSLSMAIPYFEERMRLVKPGITGLAQVALSYTGGLPDDNPLFKFKDTFLNPFHLDELDGSIADDMRTKMLFDFAYSARLEKFYSFLITDLEIIAKTPWVMFVRRSGH